MSACILSALRLTYSILVVPFSFKAWIKMIFIAYLAGMVGGIIVQTDNFERMASFLSKIERAELEKSFVPGLVSPLERNRSAFKENLRQDNLLAHSVFRPDPLRFEYPPVWWSTLVVWPVLIGLVLFVILLIVLWAWLQSRFKFVWVDTIAESRAEIVRGFKKRAKEANSFFIAWALWRLCSGLYFWIIWCLLAMLLRWSGLSTTGFAWDWLNTVKILAAPGGVLLVSMLAIAVFETYLNDFIVPIMTETSWGFKQAWRSWTALYSQRHTQVWNYLYVKFGLWLFRLALEGVAIFFPAYWVRQALPDRFHVLGSMFNILWVVIICFPFSVFFRAFSLSYWSSMLKPALVAQEQPGLV